MSTSLSLHQVTKRYGELKAVDELSLEVRVGEILGLLGPNGAGKTTTIRMMTGSLRPSSGTVLVGGRKLRQHARQIKHEIGVCPQEVVLWERLTSAENLALVGCMYGLKRDEVRRRTLGLLESLGLGEQHNARASTMSGGMKRRLNLAMALVHEPELIVLDEPITGLDPQSRLLASEVIRGLCRERGRTVVLSTHLMEVAASMCDRIAIVDHGQLLVLDTLEAMQQRLGSGDVVELGLQDETTASVALEQLRQLPGVDRVTEQAGRLRFQALGAVAMLPEIFKRLAVLGAEVETLSLRPNTLEDIFITLTGRGLRE